MAGRRKKKSNRNKNRNKTQTIRYDYSLNEIKERYNERDYETAFSYLKRAKIPPEQQEEAAELRLNISYQIAYKHFTKKNYAAVIRSLEDNLSLNKTIKNAAFPLYKSKILSGLAHLFSGNLEQAIDLLQNISNSNARYFSFYHTAALLFHHKEKYAQMSLDDFQTEQATFYNTTYSKLKQRQYMNVLFFLVKQNDEEARQHLPLIKADNDTETQNLQALKNILSGQTIETDADPGNNSRLKSLYRFILNQPLSEDETKFLIGLGNDFSVLKEKQNIQNTYQKIEKHIHNLCIKGSALPLPILDRLIGIKELEDIKPYLLYNQVACLLNEGQSKLRYIDKILIKHFALFFSVPESYNLYIKFTRSVLNNDLSSVCKSTNVQYVVNSILFYEQQVAAHLNEKRLNQWGWTICDFLLLNPIIFKPQLINNEIQKLLDKYPQIIAFRFVAFCSKVLHSEHNYPFLGIFASEDIPNWETEITYVFKELLNDIFSSLNILPNFLIDGLLPSLYEDFLIRFVDNLLPEIKPERIHENAKVILSIFPLLSKPYIDFVDDLDGSLSKVSYIKMRNAYTKLVAYFYGTDFDPALLPDYQFFMDINNKKIKKIIKKKWSEEIKVAYQEIIDKHNEERFFKSIIKVLEKDNYNFKYLERLKNFFLLWAKKASTSEISQGMNKFIQWYISNNLEFNYRSEAFLIRLFRDMVTDYEVSPKKDKNQIAALIYFFVYYLRFDLDDFDLFDRTSFIMLFLIVMADCLKENPGFSYNNTFVKDLCKYIKGNNVQDRMKNKRLNDALQFFDELFK